MKADTFRKDAIFSLPAWQANCLLPCSRARMQAAVASGKVKPIAGKFLGVERHGDGVPVMIRRRGIANTDEFARKRH